MERATRSYAQGVAPHGTRDGMSNSRGCSALPALHRTSPAAQTNNNGSPGFAGFSPDHTPAPKFSGQGAGRKL